MACFQLDTATISHQLIVGAGFPIQVLRTGAASVRGGSYLEGPVYAGSAFSFPTNVATVMIGPGRNIDSPVRRLPGFICGRNSSPYSLAVIGSVAITPNLDVALSIRAGLNIVAQGDVASFCGIHRLSAKKNFDIPHPSKDGWRLRHTCPEGPSNDVYVRGKLIDKDIIELPEYWKNFVDANSITVSITPLGQFQNIFVEKIYDNKIYLKSDTSIECFYHVYGERSDGDKLIPEYEGKSPFDYPGDNTDYNINL